MADIDPLEVLRRKGDAEIHERNWAAAAETWGAYEAASPDSLWGPFWRAYALGKLVGLDAELAILQSPRLRQIDPVQVTHRLVALYLERKEPDHALAEFKTLCALCKTDTKELDRLAQWYVRVKLGLPGMPASLFSLDEVILSRIRV